MDTDINYLFNEVPLYTKLEFKVFNIKETSSYCDVDKLELDNFINILGIGADKIVTFCHKCKMIFPFKCEMHCSKDSFYDNEFPAINFTTKFVSYSLKPGPAVINLNPSRDYFEENGWNYEKEYLLNNVIWYIEYSLECLNNSSHKYLMMISVELKNGTFIVRKIGQNPSMISQKGFDFDKYKNILESITAYDDYRHADLCYANHFYAGSFLYLRRVFERLVNSFISKKNIKDLHIDKKISSCKNDFDARVQPLLSSLYSILSKGVHVLSEKECELAYKKLKTVIDMQLEYMKTEYDKQMQSEKLKKDISRIINDVKDK